MVAAFGLGALRVLDATQYAVDNQGKAKPQPDVKEGVFS
jgi:hypothetical protein